MPDAFDYKKAFKDLYQPKPTPVIVMIPKMNFIVVEGKGDPNEPNGEYNTAIEVLYGLSYTIKMSSKNGKQPAGYFDYVVPPLEGFWWNIDNTYFDPLRKDKLCWYSIIRQPEFLTDDVFEWAKAECSRKKPNLDVTTATYKQIEEGLCVQMMHLGPFATENITIVRMGEYLKSEGYVDAISERLADGTVRQHHEIYLSDPRKTDPDKMRTVVRHPVRKIS